MALTTSPTTLASKATPRNGFGGASTAWPALSSSRITPANPDASAKAPWTRTTVGPGMGFSSGVGEATQTTLRHPTQASRPRGAPPGTPVLRAPEAPDADAPIFAKPLSIGIANPRRLADDRADASHAWLGGRTGLWTIRLAHHDVERRPWWTHSQSAEERAFC